MSETVETPKQEAHRFSNSERIRQEVLELAKNLSLNEKIALISQAVKEIKRKGKNSDQGYPYLKIEDAVNAIRPLLETHGLILTGEMLKVETIPDTKGITFQILMRWKLEDVKNETWRFWDIPGAGWDYHDKGLYKAITGSRKYAHIVIFNLPVGDNPESNGPVDRETAKAAQRNVVQNKLIEAAGKGNQTAIDALSQIEPEKKVLIGRPEEYHGHYIKVSGFLAVPAIDQYFLDTAAKRFQTKPPNVSVYWRLAENYEKGLIAICNKLSIEVEG